MITPVGWHLDKARHGSPKKALNDIQCFLYHQLELVQLCGDRAAFDADIGSVAAIAILDIHIPGDIVIGEVQ